MRAEVFPKPELPGHAVLRLHGTDASPDGMTLLVERRQGPDRFLSDTGWQRTESWLKPQSIEAFNGGLDLHVGPRVCDLVAGMTVRLAIREPDVGMVDTTVAAWPAMQTSGAHDPDRQTSDMVAGRTDKELRQARPRGDDQATVIAPRPVIPVQALEPELPEPFVDPTPQVSYTPRPEAMERPSVLSQKETQRSNVPLVLGILGGFLLLTILAGGSYWYFVLRDKNPVVLKADDTKTTDIDKNKPPTPPTAPVPPPPDYSIPVRKLVEDFLATKPTPEQMVERGRQFLKTGQIDGTYVLWRTAADQGYGPAAFELAGFYDPFNQIQYSTFPPSADRAAGMYETAAKAGVVPAMTRLGILYAKGAPGFPADKAKARDWLKQASDKGDADAKKALDALQ